MSGKLFIVGTPIGNLGDFSPRAAETLKNVDFIAAEDTRVTLHLLNHFNIKKPLISYHKHNAYERGKEIAERIAGGENCALVTDAGMPVISDPGENLVEICHNMKIQTVCVPGPCAFTSAAAISGIPCGRFTFEGFLPMNKKERKAHLESIKNEFRTMTFYEAPHKLSNTLSDLYKTLGNRKIAIVREITKIYEEVIRTDLKSATEEYSGNPLKGEIVLVIEGKPPEQTQHTMEQACAAAQELMKSGKSLNESAKEAAKISGIKKSKIYAALIRKESDGK